MTTDQQLLDFFVEQGIIQRSQVEDVLAETTGTGKTLVQVMMDFEIVTENQYYQTIADSIGADYIDLSGYEVPTEIQRLIPGGDARMYGALPIGQSGDAIVVALTDPFDSQIVDTLRFSTGRDLQVVVAPIPQIEERLAQYYGVEMGNMDEVLKQSLCPSARATAPAADWRTRPTPPRSFVTLT